MEIKNISGLCVMGCGRSGILRNDMYCGACYAKARRGGFNKKPKVVWVKPSGRNKGYKQIRMVSGEPDLIPAPVRNNPDVRCKEDGCPRKNRRQGKCDRHNGRYDNRKDIKGKVNPSG